MVLFLYYSRQSIFSLFSYFLNQSTSEIDAMRLHDLEIRLLEERPLKSSTLANSSKEHSPSPTGIDNPQDTIIRKIEIHQVSTSEKRIITQYHYRKWPDFGVPEGKEVNSFLKLVNLVSQENPSTEGKNYNISTWVGGQDNS